MSQNGTRISLAILGALAGIVGAARCSDDQEGLANQSSVPDGLDGASRMDTTGPESTTPQPSSDPVVELAKTRIAEGRQTFRFETFGDEAFWGGVLRIHEAIAGASHGGVGAGVSPTAALAVGLKVDAEALPSAVVGQIKWVQFPI